MGRIKLRPERLRWQASKAPLDFRVQPRSRAGGGLEPWDASCQGERFWFPITDTYQLRHIRNHLVGRHSVVAGRARSLSYRDNPQRRQRLRRWRWLCGSVHVRRRAAACGGARRRAHCSPAAAPPRLLQETVRAMCDEVSLEVAATGGALRLRVSSASKPFPGEYAGSLTLFAASGFAAPATAHSTAKSAIPPSPYRQCRARPSAQDCGDFSSQPRARMCTLRIRMR